MHVGLRVQSEVPPGQIDTTMQALVALLETLGEMIQGRGARRPGTGATRTPRTRETLRRQGAAAKRCQPALWKSSTAWSTLRCGLRGRTRRQPMRVSRYTHRSCSLGTYMTLSTAAGASVCGLRGPYVKVADDIRALGCPATVSDSVKGLLLCVKCARMRKAGMSCKAH